MIEKYENFGGENRELRQIKKQINIDKLKEIFEAKDADSELISNLPLVPAILTISFGLADLVPKIKDKNIFKHL